MPRSQPPAPSRRLRKKRKVEASYSNAPILRSPALPPSRFPAPPLIRGQERNSISTSTPRVHISAVPAYLRPSPSRSHLSSHDKAINPNDPRTRRVPTPVSPTFTSYSASSQRYRDQSAPFANRVVEHMLHLDDASLREFHEASRLERREGRGVKWSRMLGWWRKKRAL